MIPQSYIERMNRIMGDRAKAWIDEAEINLKHVVNKWQLESLKVLELSYNIVYSAKLGTQDVVLKLCLPTKEFMTEVHALSGLNKRSMVKLVDVDIEHRAILLESLFPGDTLWSVPYKERMAIAAPIIERVPSEKYSGEFPNHMDWIQKVYKHIDENFSGHRIHKHLDHVIRLYDNLDVENNPKMLLHGDLHHGNILSSDEWRVIDPKGVIGHKSLEIGRYMNNQIQEDGMVLDECIDHMIGGFSNTFRLSPKTMTLSFYIDMVLSTSWFFEDHEPDMTEINNRIDIIDQIYKRL